MKPIKTLKSIQDSILRTNGKVLPRILAKVMHRLLVFFLIPPFFPIFLLIRLARPFVVIRIERLVSERIGHLAGNTELYLCENEHLPSVDVRPYIDLWYLNYPVSNRQLVVMLRRVINLLPFFILEPIDFLNNFFPGGAIHKIGLNTSHDRDVHNLFDKYPAHIKFNNKENEFGRLELRRMFGDETAKFICLNVRDNKYLNSQLPWWHWSYHDYRNCDIKNYVVAAEELAKLGYYVVRMGAAVNERIPTNNPMIIDYAYDGLRTDFMDIYLGAHCSFCISNGTGFDAVPYIFRRPIIYVDHVPLGIINTFSAKFMATTKHHWLISENRPLSIEEIVRSDALYYTKTSDYSSAGIELRESSPQEIANAVLEMEGRLSGTWRNSEEDERLQAYFWSIFPKSDLHGEIRSRVGTDFLKNRLGKFPVRLNSII